MNHTQPPKANNSAEDSIDYHKVSAFTRDWFTRFQQRAENTTDGEYHGEMDVATNPAEDFILSLMTEFPQVTPEQAAELTEEIFRSMFGSGEEGEAYDYDYKNYWGEDGEGNPLLYPQGEGEEGEPHRSPGYITSFAQLFEGDDLKDILGLNDPDYFEYAPYLPYVDDEEEEDE